jgi:hypothetical protein
MENLARCIHTTERRQLSSDLGVTTDRMDPVNVGPSAQSDLCGSPVVRVGWHRGRDAQ